MKLYTPPENSVWPWWKLRLALLLFWKYKPVYFEGKLQGVYKL